jgi:hypothetical protein
MEADMWDKVDHEGFEIWVLPFPVFGPPVPNTPFNYSGYYCRHGADAHLVGPSGRFHELAETFPTEQEAREAGYREGRRLIDKLLSEGGWGAGNG